MIQRPSLLVVPSENGRMTASILLKSGGFRKLFSFDEDLLDNVYWDRITVWDVLREHPAYLLSTIS